MHVLLLEPDYYTQYPPLGLLKISTYHKTRGDTVQYIRGTERIRHLHNYPDKIYVTSLFTWAWKPVHQAVQMAKQYFPDAELLLGGVYASLMPEHARELGADTVSTGIWNELEDLVPDYSIVPKWNKEQQASIMFTHRGCIRKCSFCAVPALEGKPFQVRNNRRVQPLVAKDHKRVIFWDNNILGEPHWRDVIEEVKELDLEVDFNQGLDARLITDEVAEAFRGLKIPMIRVAYDFPALGKYLKSAIERLAEVGFNKRKIVSYVLFNFKDSPDELFERVNNLLSWGASAYPMRYQPLDTLEKDSYVGPKWTKHQLSMVAQARRVIGMGGAFPPYEGLVNKFRNAKDFNEAFELWPSKEDHTSTSININQEKSFYFYNRVICEKNYKNGRASGKPHAKLVAPNPEAIGGHQVVLVSSAGSVKRVPLLSIYQHVKDSLELPLGNKEKVISVIPSLDHELLLMVTKQGRVGVYDFKTIIPRNVSSPFVQRFKQRDKDSVVWTFPANRSDFLVLVTNRGFAWALRFEHIRSYSGAGAGFFPLKDEQLDIGNIVSALAISQGKTSLKLTSNQRRRKTTTIEISVEKNVDLSERKIFHLWEVKEDEVVTSARHSEKSNDNASAYESAMMTMGSDHQWPTQKGPQWRFT